MLASHGPFLPDSSASRRGTACPLFEVHLSTLEEDTHPVPHFFRSMSQESVKNRRPAMLSSGCDSMGFADSNALFIKVVEELNAPFSSHDKRQRSFKMTNLNALCRRR